MNLVEKQEREDDLEYRTNPLKYWLSRGMSTTSKTITRKPGDAQRIALPQLEARLDKLKRGRALAIKEGMDTRINDKYIKEWSMEADILRAEIESSK